MTDKLAKLIDDIPDKVTVPKPQKLIEEPMPDDHELDTRTAIVFSATETVPLSDEHFSRERNDALLELDRWIWETIPTLSKRGAEEFRDRERDDLTTQSGIRKAYRRRMAILKAEGKT